MPRRAADLVHDPVRSSPLDGATSVGQAGDARMLVRVGLWLEGERVVRARWRATTCPALIAYAESACEALEEGAPPATLDPAALRGRVDGVHPFHHDRAALVVAAVRAAHERARGAAP